MTTEKTVDSWISDLEPGLRRIVEALRLIILNTDPEFTESIKWGNPVYERNGRVCYLAATNAYVSLGFFNGAILADPDRIMGVRAKRCDTSRCETRMTSAPTALRPGCGKRSDSTRNVRNLPTLATMKPQGHPPGLHLVSFRIAE